MPDPEIVPPSTFPAAISPAHPPRTNTVFKGPGGFRTGWRAALFVAIAAAVAFLLTMIAGLVLVLRYGVEGARSAAQMSQMGPAGLGLTELTAFFCPTVVAALVMSRIERRPWSAYGLPLRFAFRGNFFGLVFCLVLMRTGNLWWAVGFHAGWDWGQTFFYGVPDSGIAPYHNLLNSSFQGPRWLTGGTVGPEASVFTPIILLIFAFLFTRAYRENRYRAP